MSRIHDAISRLEQQRLDPAGTESQASASSPDCSLSFLALTDPELLEGVPHVPCQPSARGEIAALDGGNWSALERFRYLAHRLQQVRIKRKLSRVLIASSIPKEGKTIVAVNLAAVLARNAGRVLLIDADMRQPNTHAVLGIAPGAGLADVLEGREQLIAALRVVDVLDIFYLAAGTPSANPVELLQGLRMRELIETTSTAFDWVVVDSPPLNLFADAHCLAAISDATLLVVRPGLTPREGLEEAVAALNGSFLAGIVLNACEDSHRERYYPGYRRTTVDPKALRPRKHKERA